MTRYLLDRDGHVWTERGDGRFCSADGVEALLLGALEVFYGPLVELVPAVGMIPAAEVEALAAEWEYHADTLSGDAACGDRTAELLWPSVRKRADALRALVARHTAEPTPEED